MPEIIVKLGDNIVQKYFFVKETMNIGRGAENEIIIENLAISRNHATINCEDGKYLLTDHGSSNGTYVNGVKVKRTELMDKDVVTLGKHKLFFYDQRASEAIRKPAFDAGDRTMLVAPTVVGILTVTKGRQKGQAFNLDKPAITLGKGNDCDIQLNDWFVSKQHAVIEKNNDEYTIRDLNSWRHTRVNGEVVAQAPLMSGDVIQLGPTVTLNFTLESSFRELDSAAAMPVPVREGTIPDQRKSVSAQHAAAKTREENEEWVKQYPRLKEEEEAKASTNGSAPHVETEAQAEIQEPVAAQGEIAPVTESKGEEVSANLIEDMAACSVAVAAQEAEKELTPAEKHHGKHKNKHKDKKARQHAAEEAQRKTQADEQVKAQEEAQALALAAQSNADQGGAMPETAAENAEEANAAAAILAACEPQPETAVAAAAESTSLAPEPQPEQQTDPKLDEEIKLWERALQNPSPVIRKQAARRLKQMTGKDYEY